MAINYLSDTEPVVTTSEHVPILDERYRKYPIRWMVLLSVTLLNLANNALWISYSAVASQATEYFQSTVGKVELLGTVSFYVGIPMCLVSTYVVDTFGFRAGMYFGTILTFMGGLVRCFSTLPGLNDTMALETQFIISILGQALTGMGNPIAVALPTKVSQNWFPESERMLATIVLAMSLPMGIVLGQGCSPLIVRDASDVPTMNIIWMALATATMVSCVVFIRSSNPPTPPSLSAELASHQARKSFREYLSNMKAAFTNGPFMVLFVAMGGAVGFFNALSAVLSQLMCSRGYSNTFSGICGSLLLGIGFVGAIASGWFVENYGKMSAVMKVYYVIAGIFGVLIVELMRFSDLGAWIALFCALFGVFGFGAYPIGLELSVEALYPIDESIGAALIFMSGLIQAAFLVAASQFMEQDLEGKAKEMEVCSIKHNTTTTYDFTTTTLSTTPTPQPLVEAKDHTHFLHLMAVYLSVIVVLFCVLFKNMNKRTLANKETGEEEIE